MGTKILKILLAVGVVTALSLGSGEPPSAAASANRELVHPHIISQRSDMVKGDNELVWERHIFVRNPLSRPVWFWIECESRLTSKAIGLSGHHTSDYVFPNIPPAEGCVLNHWIPQVQGQSPPEWRP